MKSNFAKTALSVIALSTLAFAATAAQAGYDPDDRRAYPGQSWGQPGPVHVPFPVQFQSRRLIQIIDDRQARQHERIMSGMQNRQLGRGEFHSLMREQNEIREMERHFLADGLMTQAEFQRIDRALDAASHSIQVARHDRPAHYAYGNPWHY